MIYRFYIKSYITIKTQLGRKIRQAEATMRHWQTIDVSAIVQNIRLFDNQTR